MSEVISIDLDNGKYTVILSDGTFVALRHGEPWRDLCGDNLIFFLVHRIAELEEEKAKGGDGQ